MSTQYVKLIAKPDTWYKAGSEVFWEGNRFSGGVARRPTLLEWEDIKKPENAGIGCVGIRVTESPESEGGGVVGEERWDGEWCMIDEFDVEMVDEQEVRA